MRLLYICNDFGIKPNGTKGASIHLRAITAALCNRGHQVWIASPHGGPAPVHAARFAIDPAGGEVRDAPKRLKRWLKTRELDVACAQELRPLLYNDWAFDQLRDASAIGPCDAIIERLASCSTLGLDLAALWDVPLIVEANAILSTEAGAYRSIHNDSLVRQIEQRTLTGADAVIAVSEVLAEQVVSVGVNANHVYVAPNGVDADMFANVDAATIEFARNSLNLKGKRVVGFAGSLKQWHGVDDLVRAFAKLSQPLKDTALLIVGEGPMLASLRSLSDELGVIDRVVFTGAVEHRRMPAMLGLMDVAVAPFRPMEQFYFSPIKLFEYMSAGALVVASDVGQIANVIEHERNGLLYAAGSIDRLTEALKHALSSPQQCAEMTASARRLVCERFTWDETARITESVVRRSIDARTRRMPNTTCAFLSEVSA